MRTVAWLKAELDKFPDEALCFAYEGEVTGIVIEAPGGADAEQDRRQGTIHCSKRGNYDELRHETELLPAQFGPSQEQLATARIARAAPRLLAALQDLVRQTNACDGTAQMSTEEAEAAIQEALGTDR